MTLPQAASAPAAGQRALAEEERGAAGRRHYVLAPAAAARPQLCPRDRHRPPREVVDHVRRAEVVLQLVTLAWYEHAALILQPHRLCVGNVPWGKFNTFLDKALRNGHISLNFGHQNVKNLGGNSIYKKLPKFCQISWQKNFGTDTCACERGPFIQVSSKSLDIAGYYAGFSAEFFYLLPPR